jgi:hypothetical protein
MSAGHRRRPAGRGSRAIGHGGSHRVLRVSPATSGEVLSSP